MLKLDNTAKKAIELDYSNVIKYKNFKMTLSESSKQYLKIPE